MADFTYQEPRPGVLTISGEMTVDSARALKELLLATLARHERVEIDLLNVTKLDTAGVQLLLLAQREATRRARTLSWLGCSLAVEEALELLDLRDLLGQPQAVVWT